MKTVATNDLVGEMLLQPSDCGLTLAVVVLSGGEIVAEGYGPDTTAETPLISWSMAKSVVHSLVGVLVRDGRLDIDEPIASLPKRGITVRHLLEMRSGLGWREDYVDAGSSDVIEMLFGSGKDDVAGFAGRLPVEHAPGAHWSYSSGTTNIISRLIGDIVGGGALGMRAFMEAELFRPLAFTSATPHFDRAGTFIGSSFLYCTARDFARFGELYLRGGVIGGRRILPEGWVEYARTPAGAVVPAEEIYGYGAHWWLWDRVGMPGVFAAHGYEGQRIVVDPSRDLVVVRLGKTAEEQKANVDVRLRAIIGSFPKH